MTSPTPHYLLFCDGNIPAHGEKAGSQRGKWRFVLENLASGEKIEATDQEIGCAPDRSALTAVLRGLEALEQPSRVTLVTTSRYVTRGLQYGLSEWRDNDYTWEHFGAVQPIRNADIWKRIDRALAFHQVR
jgi:ribonuclease HI